MRHIGEVAVVVRDVVEEGEAGVGDVLEVEDVERGGVLVEAVAVFSRVESEQGRDEKADGGLVGDDDELLTLVAFDELQEGG